LHRVIAIPSFGALGGSALTDRSIRVPKKALGRAGIPSTYVPARNTLFLAFALGAAETSGATEIVIGANVLDYSGYPDCRPAFLRAFERVANLGTKAGDEGRRFSIRAPLLRMARRTSSGSRSPSASTPASRRPATTRHARDVPAARATRASSARRASPGPVRAIRARADHRAEVAAASSRARARSSRGGSSRG
jgi:hypothetical protein